MIEDNKFETQVEERARALSLARLDELREELRRAKLAAKCAKGRWSAKVMRLTRERDRLSTKHEREVAALKASHKAIMCNTPIRSLCRVCGHGAPTEAVLVHRDGCPMPEINDLLGHNTT